MAYVTLALVVTWPALKFAETRVVVGTEVARTVPIFNVWTIWWNADRPLHGWEGYWDAPIFFPASNTFAFSEPQPLALLVSPIIWWTGSRVLAMNVYLWFSIAMNGWMAERLLRYAGLRWWVSVVGGMAMALLPIVHWQIGVEQLVPLWGVLWSLLVFLKLGRLHEDRLHVGWSRAMWVGCELGLAFASIWMACVHHGLMFGLVMLVVGWSLGPALLRKHVWISLVCGATLFFVLISPIAMHLYAMTQSYSFTRPQELVAQLSLYPSDYVRTYGHTIVEPPNAWGRMGWRMSPGWEKVLLAAVGLVVGWRRGRRSFTTMLTLLVGVSFVLSLGLNFDLFGWKPWLTISKHVPGFGQIRSVFRFGYFAQVGVVLLAAVGVDGLWSLLSRWRDRVSWSAGAGRLWRWSCRGFQGAVLIFGLLATLDPWPPSPLMGVVPDLEITEPWVNHLANAADRSAAICLPMAGGDDVRDYEITAEWMFLGTYHGLPLVNGYSGFFPPAYFATRNRMLTEGMTSEELDTLVSAGVRWIIVDRRRFSVSWDDQLMMGRHRLRREVGDGSRIDVYHVQ